MKGKYFNEKLGLLKAFIDGKKKRFHEVNGLESVNENPDNYYLSHGRGDGAFCFNEKTKAFNYEHLGEGDVVCKPRYNRGEEIYIQETYCKGNSNLLDDKTIKYWIYKDGSQKFSHGKYFPADRTEQVAKQTHIKWESPHTMSLQSARHFFTITNIRVERLQNISDEDCLKEGIEQVHEGSVVTWKHYTKPSEAFFMKQGSFASLVNKIDGKGTWEKNRWVFVYEIEKKPHEHT